MIHLFSRSPEFVIKVRGAARLLIIVSIVASAVGLAAAPASAAPALTVTPGPTGLHDRQIVTVTGTGFPAGDPLFFTQCIGAEQGDCADGDVPVNTNVVGARADDDGNVTATLRLPRVLEYGDDQSASCADGDCSIKASSVATFPTVERARVAIDFEATGTAPALPAPTVSASAGATSPLSTTVTFGGSGYLPWSLVPIFLPGATTNMAYQFGASTGAYVGVCAPASVAPTGCTPWFTLYSTPWWGREVQVVPVAADGTASGTVEVPRLGITPAGLVDCAVEECELALLQDQTTPSPTVQLEWAAEWAPWTSADAFIDATYDALVGEPPSSEDRSDYRDALIDRTITGSGLLVAQAENPDGHRVAELTRLYQAALARKPDAAGLTYWAGELVRNGGSMNAIAAAFARTREFRTGFGIGAGTDEQGVIRAYTRTLGRHPSASELAYWKGRLQAGLARSHMVHLFSRAPEYVNRERQRSQLTAILHGFFGRVPDYNQWAGLAPTKGPGVRDDVLDEYLYYLLGYEEMAEVAAG